MSETYTLYNSTVMEHFMNPRNMGDLKDADVVGEVGAAACGDIMKISLKIKDGLMGSKRLSAAEVEQLADLPSKEVLLAKMLGTLNAPASNFVGVLAAVPRSLLNVLTAIEKKKA